ncbi:bacteriohemerythrin [Breznakiellaceae bacterium SP9]
MQFMWIPTLETGNELIDSQHKELFAAINHLLRSIDDGKSGLELKKSIDFLSDYTAKHFSDEEALQKQYAYPDYTNHKKYHEGFKQVVRDLQAELQSKGPSPAFASKVQIEVGDWLVKHIQMQDVKIAAHIRSAGK